MSMKNEKMLLDVKSEVCWRISFFPYSCQGEKQLEKNKGMSICTYDLVWLLKILINKLLFLCLPPTPLVILSF